MGGSASSNGKSAASLEKEIMRLQDVLKEREAEIALLEESLKAAECKAENLPPPLPTIKTNGSAITSPPPPIDSREGELVEEDHSDDEDRSGRSTPISSFPVPPVNLSPKTMNQFRAIRNSLDLDVKPGSGDSAPPPEQDNLLERLNELMR